MSMHTGTEDVSGILPDQVGALVVQPVVAASVAAQVSTVISISGHTYRVPRVTADPSAAWTAEGAEIDASDAVLDEIDCTPSKVAGLTVISNELANDSTPAAQTVVGQGLARDIARRVDEAFLGDTTANGPSGLESVAGDMQAVGYGSEIENLDPFYEAVSVAQQHGGQPNFFLTDPATALTIKTLKLDSTDANANLPWGADLPPVIVSPYCTEGVVYALDSRYTQFVLREGATLAVDKSAYFTSDQTAVRAVMRVGFAHVFPEAQVRIASGSGS